MSVQVLRVRFPGLSVAVSVERPRRQQEGRLSPSNHTKAKRAQPDQRFSTAIGVESSLIKLQI